jgi:hypothetical protein
MNLRYLFTIIIVATINAQLFADATSDTIDAIGQAMSALTIIGLQPWAHQATEEYYVVETRPGKGDKLAIPDSMKDYFKQQRDFALERLDAAIESLEKSIPQVTSKEFQGPAKMYLNHFKEAQTAFKGAKS